MVIAFVFLVALALGILIKGWAGLIITVCILTCLALGILAQEHLYQPCEKCGRRLRTRAIRDDGLCQGCWHDVFGANRLR